MRQSSSPSAFFLSFSVSGSKLAAGCEEIEERSGDREELCVYIWSQISLMDEEEEYSG